MLASCAVATHRGSIGQAIAVTTPDQFTNLSDNYLWSDGLNTSFSQAGLALPQPPYQPNWPEFFDGAVDNRTVKGHPGYLPDGPAGGRYTTICARIQIVFKYQSCMDSKLPC